MAGRSPSKRRHSTRTSPVTSDSTGEVGSPTTRRPPKKKGKRGSKRVSPEEEGSRSNSRPRPPTQGRSLPARPEKGPSSPKSSIPTMTWSDTNPAVPFDTQTTVSEEPVGAVPGPLELDVSSQSTNIPGLGLLMPQKELTGTLEEGSLEITMPETSSIIYDFIWDAMSLSPLYFPPLGASQGTPRNTPGLAGSSLGQSYAWDPLINLPERPGNNSLGSVYPAITSDAEIGVYGHQMQEQQFQASTSPLLGQQAYSAPIGTWQTFQSQGQVPIPAQDLPANPHGSVHQAQFMPTGHLQPIDPWSQPRPFSQGIAASAQAGITQYQSGHLSCGSTHDAAAFQSMIDPCAGQQIHASHTQLAQAEGPSMKPSSSHSAPPNLPPSADIGITHTWTASTIPQAAVPPQQNPARTQNPSQQQQQQQRQQRPTATHHLASLFHQQEPQRQSLPSQAPSPPAPTPHQATTTAVPNPNPTPYPIVPVEPRTASERYLWTQLDTAQLTMLGTLTDLVARARDGEVSVERSDGQVRAVTRNLINVMTLWYMLRRNRGWLV